MTAIQDIRVHAPVIIAEAVCLIVFCSLMVGLRYYARRVKKSRLGLDDLAIGVALVRISVFDDISARDASIMKDF